MARAQRSSAPNCATTAQAGPLNQAKIPVPTPCKEDKPTVTDSYFRAPANRNPNCSASQRPALLPAFCVLPWRRDGRIQMWRGAKLARPDTDV